MVKFGDLDTQRLKLKPPMAPNNSPLAPTILPLALAAIGRMALVSNISSTSADVVVQSDASAIRPMAASARGEMVGARGELLGARGELLGARGGCGPDLHCSQGRLWLLEFFGARGGCGTYGPYLGFNFRLWVSRSQNFTIYPTKWKMQLVLLFSTKPVRETKKITFCSPLNITGGQSGSLSLSCFLCLLPLELGCKIGA